MIDCDVFSEGVFYFDMVLPPEDYVHYDNFFYGFVNTLIKILTFIS